MVALFGGVSLLSNACCRIPARVGNWESPRCNCMGAPRRKSRSARQALGGAAQVLGGSDSASLGENATPGGATKSRVAVVSDPWALIHRNRGVQATIAAKQRELHWGPYPAVPCRTSRLRASSGFNLISRTRQNSNSRLKRNHSLASSMPITTQPCACEACKCEVDPASAVEKVGMLYCSAPCADGHAGNDVWCTSCDCC